MIEKNLTEIPSSDAPLAQQITAKMLVEKGLMLHYPFHGTAEDASGREQHGAIYHAALTKNRLGMSNRAFQFAHYDSYIYAKLKKYDYKKSTIACWVYWQQRHALACIFHVGHSGRNGFGLLMSDSCCGGGAYLSLLLGGVQCDAFSGAVELPSLEWVHLCLVKNESKWTLFMNGKKRIQVTHAYSPPDEMFSVGGCITNLNASFGGIVSDFRWFNRVLSPIKIKALYENT
ncbi:MAG: hypothetical protein RLZZ628_2112 [Bacteroidota bacterium]|jgi:hypothetical protein